MINFKRIDISDKEWIEPLLLASGFTGSDYTFSNNFIYRKIYRVDVAQMNGFYLLRSSYDDKYSYFYPAGSGDIKPVIQAILDDAQENGRLFSMHNVTKECVALLESIFPEKFQFEELRENFDYIYESQRLITLSGKKLHSKRNFINRFKMLHGDKWSYEPITLQNIDECWDMNVRWCQRYGCEQDRSLMEEFCAVRNCFNHFGELGLIGGLLRVDGEIVAYTMGHRVSHDTFVIHIEKAFSELEGAYPMINQQFVTNALSSYRYINREDDLGDEGLRKAKLSYKPDILLEKYLVTLK